MNLWYLNKVNQRISIISMAAVLIISTFCAFISFQSANAVQSFSKDDTPFGTDYNGWLTNYWKWWIATTVDEATPKPDGCLINSTDSMVILMDTGVNGKPHQVCNISSSQGIMIDLWSAWCDESGKDDSGTPRLSYSYDQLTKCARENFDLGAVTSLVKVDDTPVAKLDVVSSIKGGALVYQINSIENVTEIFSKGFNITIPEDTHFPDQTPGTFRSGAHGWFVFLKPLPPGDHTLYYNVGVTGLGPNDHSAEITYDLKVK
jgi:hypothetical protein